MPLEPAPERLDALTPASKAYDDVTLSRVRNLVSADRGLSDLVLAVLGVGLLVFALVNGMGWEALVIVGAIALRLAMWRYWRGVAASSRRHRELRRRRLERERAGLAPRRD